MKPSIHILSDRKHLSLRCTQASCLFYPLTKKNWGSFLLLLCFFCSFTPGCNIGDFGDINVNPKATTVPITSALLSGATRQMGEPYPWEGLYCQYFSESQYTEYSRYATFNFGYHHFTNSLINLENIILTNMDEDTREKVQLDGSNNNQIATARILKVFFAARVTDVLGDMPYSEALQGKADPVYDTQESIYRKFFQELDEAVKQFDQGLPVNGDLLFDGDIVHWKKFANSLRLILALRLSRVDEALAKAEATAALAANQSVIGNNDDNAELWYPGGIYRNIWHDVYRGRKDFGISEVMVNYLEDLGDPRLPVYGNPGPDGKVTGIPYGLPRELAIEFIRENPNWSFVLAADWRTETAPFPILTAAHVFLARAEAAALGWTDEDAAALYRAGIQASMEYWGVFDPTLFEAYMAQPRVAFTNDAKDLERIRFQRWLAFYPNGYQGWSEWRRTGVPDLQPTPYATNVSKQIPRRFQYDPPEANLNPTNYQAAVDRLGGDTMDGRVWWDPK